ncbi:MAG: large conductance mechanosensitive channel protein MscL [Candidatus Doudnabacteria bacterium]
MLKDFKQFILRGNVVDLAVGIVIGAAFSAVINALVKDFLTPLLSALFSAPNVENLAFTLRGSRFAYGDFVNSIISFLLISAGVFFFIVTPVNALVSRSKRENPPDPATKKCPFCLSEVANGATRCAFCTQPI